MYVKCGWKGERERDREGQRDSLLIRTRHRLGYRRGVYRRCMESGTNMVGNVPSLRMMDDRGRLYRQTIWKSRYGGGSNSIWWDGESKAGRKGRFFCQLDQFWTVRLLEGCWGEDYYFSFELRSNFFFSIGLLSSLVGNISLLITCFWKISSFFFLWIIIWSLSLSLFRFSSNSCLANRKWDKSKKNGSCALLFFWLDN